MAVRGLGCHDPVPPSLHGLRTHAPTLRAGEAGMQLPQKTERMLGTPSLPILMMGHANVQEDA